MQHLTSNGGRLAEGEFFFADSRAQGTHRVERGMAVVEKAQEAPPDTSWRPLERALKLCAIAKSYGPVRAVDSVDLTVPQGQFLTLLGPSGSGKTTMLMMIAGFIAPDSGEMLFDDRSITYLPPEKRNFGMVFQGYALFPHLSVFDNIAFPLKVRRQSAEKIRQQVQRALEMVQLQALADRLPRQLSGGQQQRVALARALVFDPAILLLDEPLGALDRKLRAELQIELKQLHERLGATFIYVTHDQEEALSMSDRIAIVRDGRFVQIGSPAELYERPATRFVAGFLGESNFITGRVTSLTKDGFTYGAGGQTYFQTASLSTVAPGQAVLLAMRPEKVVVSTESTEGCANRVQGRVLTWNYFGSNFHLTVEADGLGRMFVLCPTWRVLFEPKTGMSLWLGWDANATVVVKDD
jgi:putative spermidine/putrescine transport system ATP-binding protein